MTRDREGTSKSNKNTKKHAASSTTTTEFSGFLKKQSDIVSGLKTQLQNSTAEKQHIQIAAMERNKCIHELQKTIDNRDTEIKKLVSDLSAVKEENTKTLKDFHIFKDTFFKLESHYDTECEKQNRKMDAFRQQLDTLQSQENELIQECDRLKQQLHEKSQSYAKLGLDYAEQFSKMEKNQQEFVRQQKNFEDFKKQVDVEKLAYNDKLTLDMNALKQEILHKEEHFAMENEKLLNELLEKDDLIKQCIRDKDIVVEEKNRKIQELNYKISKIEKVFVQPTKGVNPMVSIPNTPQTPSSSRVQQTTKASNNVAVTKPQQRQEFAEINTSRNNVVHTNNIKTELPETSNRLRSMKIPRPSNTSGLNVNSSISNSNNSNKRAQFKEPKLLRNPSPPPSANPSPFSTPSTDDDDNDLFIPQWGPKHYVPETETDASECFFKPKRPKKETKPTPIK